MFRRPACVIADPVLKPVHGRLPDGDDPASQPAHSRLENAADAEGCDRLGVALVRFI